MNHVVLRRPAKAGTQSNDHYTKFDLHEFRLCFAYLKATEFEAFDAVQFSQDHLEEWQKDNHGNVNTHVRFGDLSQYACVFDDNKTDDDHGEGVAGGERANEHDDGAQCDSDNNEDDDDDDGDIRFHIAPLQGHNVIDKFHPETFVSNKDAALGPVDYCQQLCDLDKLGTQHAQKIIAHVRRGKVTEVSDESANSICESAPVTLNTGTKADDTIANVVDTTETRAASSSKEYVVTQGKSIVEEWVQPWTYKHFFTKTYPSIYCPVKDDNGNFYVANEFLGNARGPLRVNQSDYGRWVAIQMCRSDGMPAQHATFPLHAVASMQRKQVNTTLGFHCYEYENLTADCIKARGVDEEKKFADKITNSIRTSLIQVRGTKPYWASNGRNLRSMLLTLSDKGSAPFTFFTLTMAEQEWEELRTYMHSIYVGLSSRGVDTDIDCDKIMTCDTEFRKVLYVNDHIVTNFFALRVAKYMRHFLKPNFGVEEYWYRFEFSSGIIVCYHMLSRCWWYVYIYIYICICMSVCVYVYVCV